MKQRQAPAHKWGRRRLEGAAATNQPQIQRAASTGYCRREGLWVPLGDKAALGLSHEQLKRSRSEVQEEESGVFSRSLELLQTQMDLYFPNGLNSFGRPPRRSCSS